MGQIFQACQVCNQAKEAVDDVRAGDYKEAAAECGAAWLASNGYTKTAWCLACCVDDDKNDGQAPPEQA